MQVAPLHRPSAPAQHEFACFFRQPRASAAVLSRISLAGPALACFKCEMARPASLLEALGQYILDCIKFPDAHIASARHTVDPMNPDLNTSLQKAIELHMAGEYEAAVACYRAILEQDPIHPVALHYFGIYLFQTGLHEEALEHLIVSSELEPENAIWQNDLGNVCFSLKKFGDAEIAFLNASRLAPSDHNVWTNLGATYLQLGEREKGERCFQTALDIAPDCVPALLHLADLHREKNEPFLSAQYQCRAYVLPPHEGKSQQLLATSFYFLGRLPEAMEVYQNWLQQEPDNPIARHMLAACSQMDIPPRATDHYLEEHFDAYADHFDINLRDRLKYRGPECILNGLSQLAPLDRTGHALDLGCGTGLCGEHLASVCQNVTGIDLSARMLEKAGQTGFYDTLIRSEIGSFLDGHGGSYDLVVAADTLIYFGGLESLLLRISGALRDGGHFVFTTEDRTDALPGYHLHSSGRYQHSREYVQACLVQAGLCLRYDKGCGLRMEIASMVPGTVYVAQKRSR